MVNTLISYIKYVQDSFLIEKAQRYNLKGEKSIQTSYKFYFSDIGLKIVNQILDNKKQFTLWRILFIMNYYIGNIMSM